MEGAEGVEDVLQAQEVAILALADEVVLHELVRLGGATRVGGAEVDVLLQAR